MFKFNFANSSLCNALSNKSICREQATDVIKKRLRKFYVKEHYVPPVCAV